MDKPPCHDEDIDSAEIHKEMCKRSCAVENCGEIKEKMTHCYEESSKAEAQEDCQFGQIDERRRSFIKKNKDDLSKVAAEKFHDFIPKHHVDPHKVEEHKVDEHKEGSDCDE